MSSKKAAVVQTFLHNINVTQFCHHIVCYTANYFPRMISERLDPQQYIRLTRFHFVYLPGYLSICKQYVKFYVLLSFKLLLP